MKIIDAKWDAISLKKKTYEIIIENSDTIDNINEALLNIEAEYEVVKVPSGLPAIDIELQKMGFVFIEEQITVEHDLHEVKRPSVLQRMYDSMEYSLMSDEEFKILIDEVKGGLFSTDRISIDPNFGIEYSINRYVNWINQLHNSNANIYALKYKNDLEGFVIIKNSIKEDEYDSVLGGAFKKYRNSGLGLVQKEQDIVKSLGGKKLYTSVSSNNVSQLKALIVNGYIPIKITKVFVKHI